MRTSERLLRSRGVQSILATIAIAALALAWVHHQGGPEGIHRRYGGLAPAIWLPLQTVVYLTPAGDFVPWPVLNGSLFGLWLGTAATWLCWMGSASVQYAIGRRTAQDLDWEVQSARLPAWLRAFPLGHPVFLIVARWFPLMAGPINLAAGATRVPFARLLWCTAVGNGPPALLLAAVGVGLLRAT